MFCLLCCSHQLQPPQASTARAHGGSHSALLGWTASPEAEGDSGILQQISIPATATRAILSFWYFPSSTDNGSDRQEVWVLDTNLNKLAEVLYVIDANNQAWVPVGYDMTQFIGKTVDYYLKNTGIPVNFLSTPYGPRSRIESPCAFVIAFRIAPSTTSSMLFPYTPARIWNATVGSDDSAASICCGK